MGALGGWPEIWKRLGAPVTNDELLQELVARYSEPHRRYHTLRHLDECFERLDEIRAEAERPAEVELALWFHDAIYDTKRQDNEAKSAAWASSSVLSAGLHPDIAARVRALIMATRHNAVPDGPDEKVLVDVDLSIL